MEVAIRSECLYFFGVFVGIYDYYYFSFVGLNEYHVSVKSFWINFLILCNCLFCMVLWWLSKLKICFIFLAAILRFEFYGFVSRSFMALSVSTRRLVQYVFSGLSILYCMTWFSRSISSFVNLIFVRFFVLG